MNILLNNYISLLLLLLLQNTQHFFTKSISSHAVKMIAAVSCGYMLTREKLWFECHHSLITAR